MRFLIKTLGCKVNAYESAVVSEILKKSDWEEVKENADVCIINTCTVTNTADLKSLKIIRQLSRMNRDAVTVVMGCYSQANIEVLKNMDEVDIIIGTNTKSKILEYIELFLNTNTKIIDVLDPDKFEFDDMVLTSFPHKRAFVKIEDGCDNYCSYCIIPYVRGHVRSKEKELVISEIKDLVCNGFEEIVLTGIHTGHYGSDLENYSFADLLSDILKIKDLKYIRISSIEITELNDNFLKILKSNKVIVDHLHIPLQSGSDTILKLMNRKYDKEYFSNKIDSIRKIRPDISITTDVIVGFPSETDELFDETIETIKKISFSKIHVFPFSSRNGTPASNMDNQVSESIKKKRVIELIELSKELEIKYMEKFVGKPVNFIVEVIRDGYAYGHTGNYLNIKSINTNGYTVIKKIEYPYCID